MDSRLVTAALVLAFSLAALVLHLVTRPSAPTAPLGVSEARDAKVVTQQAIDVDLSAPTPAPREREAATRAKGLDPDACNVPSRAASREVLVLGADGSIVQGAACSSAPDWNVVATTDSRGIAESASLEGSVEVTIRAPGRSTRRIQLPGGERSRERVTVALEHAGVIVGEARDPLGRPVGAGARVLAVPPTAHLDDIAIVSALRGAGPLHMAITDERGVFRLDGLELGVAHRIYAGGAGLILLDPFQRPEFPRAEDEGERPLDPFVELVMK